MKELMDLHTHTLICGHAYSTLMENIQSAKEKGLKIYGYSEHAPKMPETASELYFKNMKVIKDNIMGVRILKGIEANVLDYNGNIDVSDEIQRCLDYMIVSIHRQCFTCGTIEENTNALVKAMQIEKVKIIGHPDDSRYPLDYEILVKEAKKNNIFLEINNSSLYPTSFRQGARENCIKMLKLCAEYKTKIIFGSDAHICYDVGNFENCVQLINELDFPKELIANYDENFLDYFLS